MALLPNLGSDALLSGLSLRDQGSLHLQGIQNRGTHTRSSGIKSMVLGTR